MPHRPPCSARRRLFALASLLVPALAPLGAVERIEARALDPHDGRLLYREVHLHDGAGAQARRVVVYHCPDGAAFARKHVVARGTPEQPDVAFHDARTGYREGVRSRGTQREIFVGAGAGVAERVAPLPVNVDGIVDAGFDAAVRGRWSTFDGGLHRAAFLVPERFAFVPVRITGDAGEPGTRRLRMTLDRWFGFAAPSVALRYDVDGRRLREFVGPGTVRDAQGRPRAVRIVFPAHGEAATRADLEAALALPLDGRCTT